MVGDGPPVQRPPVPLEFRRPTEADQLRIVSLLDETWAGVRLRHLLPRLWARHFAGTSWVALTPTPAGGEPRLAGFLVGFASPDRPDTGYVHLVAVDGNVRRRGVGRALMERFVADLVGRGVRRVETVVWPADRVSVEFFEALGFRAQVGEGSQKMWGVPAYPDYDDEGADRAVFVLELPAV